MDHHYTHQIENFYEWCFLLCMFVCFCVFLCDVNWFMYTREGSSLSKGFWSMGFFNLYVCMFVCLCGCIYFFGDANSFVHSADGSSQHAPANPSLMHLTSWGMDHLWRLWENILKTFFVALALFAKLNHFGPPEVGFHVNRFICLE